MRYIGLDFGTTLVGVAVSDEAGSFAFPRTSLKNDDMLVRSLSELAQKEHAAGFVMGDTRSNGHANPITLPAEAFAAKLSEVSGLPVARVREDWSSFEAKRFAPEEKQHDDSAAAAIILQRFLDTRLSTPGTNTDDSLS
jgi:putative Holliday junction resolvase